MSHLFPTDPTMQALAKAHPDVTITRRDEPFFTSLASAIISQQLSVKAAATIEQRFVDATRYDTAHIASMTDDEFRTCGISKQKAGYLRDLAAHFQANPSVYNHLDTLDDEQIIQELTAVKGIGRWTAQMFLLFTLGRPDVFAPDDLGLRRAMEKLYAIPRDSKPQVYDEFAIRWSPHRSLACRLLWRSLDNEP